MNIDLTTEEVNIITQALARVSVSGPPEAHMLLAQLQIKLTELVSKEQEPKAS